MCTGQRVLLLLTSCCVKVRRRRKLLEVKVPLWNDRFFKEFTSTTMKVAEAHIPANEIKPHTVAKIRLQSSETREFFNRRVNAKGCCNKFTL